MNDLSPVLTAASHTVQSMLHRLAQRRERSTAAAEPSHDAPPDPMRDRGAISLEQVLWFVAAGVSVAVIAAILWNQIRDQANTPIDTPSAP